MTTLGAEVQVENGGWFKLHNSISEVLARTPLNGQQFRCLHFLLRMTYGHKRKEAKLSWQEWADGTGMKRQNVGRELMALLEAKIIYRTEGVSRRPATWGFNKYYETWLNPGDIVEDVTVNVLGDIVLDVSGDIGSIEYDVTTDIGEHVTAHWSKDIKTKKKEGASTASAKYDVSDFAKAYYRIWGLPVPSAYISDKIAEWAEILPLDLWEYALQEAVKYNKRNWPYLEVILTRVHKEGLPIKPDLPGPVKASTNGNRVDFSLEDIDL